MRPNYDDNNLTGSPVASSARFGISDKHQAHIMVILRDTLYSDKILAVLREYSSNAWDAHREVGKDDTPIKVVIPTELDPTLRIRDFGPGMSKATVYEVYANYGASTKRDTDRQVGMLGIGSKSGFAYGDSFMITSWHGGAKTLYSAVLDADAVGEIRELHSEPCGVDETGIEISIAVKVEDCDTFASKAEWLFEHFQPQPDINIDLGRPKEWRYSSKNGCIGGWHGDGWIARMGCVPYRVDPRQLREALGDYQVARNVASKNAGIIQFDVGEVEITASREELKWSERTVEAAKARMEALVEGLVAQEIKRLQDPSSTGWEKRLAAIGSEDLGIASHALVKEWSSERVTLWTERPHLEGDAPEAPKKGAPKHFTMWSCSDSYGWDRSKRNSLSKSTVIPVDDEFKFILMDDARSIKGFLLNRLHHRFRLIRPIGGDIAKAKAELDAILKSKDCDGVPMINLSTVEWEGAPARMPSVANTKHNKRLFKYKGADLGGQKSDSWEVFSGDLDGSHPFVVLERFVPTMEFGDFHAEYRHDSRLARSLGVEMPEVIGIKSTKQKRVTLASAVKDEVGTPYQIWRKRWLKQMAKVSASLIQDARWADSTMASVKMIRGVLNDSDSLPVGHPIRKILCRVLTARLRLERSKFCRVEVVKRLSRRVEVWGHNRSGDWKEGYPGKPRKVRKSRYERRVKEHRLKKILNASPLINLGNSVGVDVESDVLGNEVFQAYPLFRTNASRPLDNLLGSDSKLWLDYISLVDRCAVAP